MNTYNDMKQKFIDHMMAADFDKMNTMDLANVALIIKTIYDAEKEDYVDKLLDKMGSFAPTFNCAAMPEVTDNG